MTALSFTRVRVVVGSGLRARAILTDVSFEIDEGSTVGLVGPSGSGKTTILNLVSGLLRPTSGIIRVLGTDMATASDVVLSRLRSSRIGIVFQNFHLMPQASALDNVTLPAFFGQGPVRSARARARELLVRVGLGELADSAAVELSEGQRQRVAIARALVARPVLVLADEPTGNLDDASASAILSLLVEAVRCEGATLLLATHDRRCLNLVERSLRVENGRVDPT